MKFLTIEQQAVVEYRIKNGYEFILKQNGNYILSKKRHIMEINCLGYDCYVSPSLI
jgi:hypothetical protein